MSLRKLSISDRQKLIQTKAKSDLKNIKSHALDLSKVEGHNCEQTIGACQVPLAVAGPIYINSSDFGKLQKYIPLATTEGALIASVQRGIKACQQINTFSQIIGTTRGPYLKVKNIAQAQDIISYINTNWRKLQTLVTETESHAKLLKFTHQILGKNLYLRFYFDTSEAMGMNMVTIASKVILDNIKKEFKNIEYIISGNFCIDKKPAFSNSILGRGKKVWAEAIISRDKVKQTLKTTPERIVQVVNKKQHLGSIAAGSLSHNAHFANIIAAFFLATGQDLAHVVEGSLGTTTAQLEGDNLYFSIYLPAIMIGTIGGGTHLPTQHEALQILDLANAKPNSSRILSEILAASVLTGELSLTAAIAAGHLAKAHQSLGRSK